MKLTTVNRPLYADELLLLQQALAFEEARGQRKFGLKHYIIILVCGCVLSYFAYLSSTHSDLLVFVFGTLSVLCFGFVVFMPYEEYKGEKKARERAAEIARIISSNFIEVTPVKATRIALAPEYEDETNLYILEIGERHVLYLWDAEYNLEDKFQCLHFEVYGSEFITDRMLYPLSDRVEPVVLDRNKKWELMSSPGLPEHKHIEEAGFDEVVARFGVIEGVEP